MNKREFMLKYHDLCLTSGYMLDIYGSCGDAYISIATLNTNRLIEQYKQAVEE
jgi:hypothetical protein